MAYVNHNRILTVGSVSVSSVISNTTLFSTTAPETRPNGGDLLDGDRWINPDTFIECVYYDGRWHFINPATLSNIDGGDAENDELLIIDLGDAYNEDLVVIYDGGNALG